MRLHDAMEQGCNGFRSVLRRTPGGPHLPPAPLLSHAVGEEGGDERSRGDSALASVTDAKSTTQITPLPRCGRGAGGEGCPHLPPASLLSHAVGEEGEMSGAGAILHWHLSTMPKLHPRSPLSRSAGEGSGVRAALTSPLPPPLPRCGRGGGR